MTEPTMEREDGGPDEYECGNCGSVWTFSQLQPIDSYFERVSAGGIVPAGECPDENCGALCSPVPLAAPAAAAADPQAAWCLRLVDAYNTLMAGDVLFDPQSDDENAQLDNATELLCALVDEAQAYLQRQAKGGQ